LPDEPSGDQPLTGAGMPHCCILYPIRIQCRAGIQPKQDKKLRMQLTALDAATQPQDLAVIPGWRLHELKGDQAGRWSITVNGNWRVTFGFEATDVVLLDYEDYH